MNKFHALSISTALVALIALSGCGMLSVNFVGDLYVDFTVDAEGDRYDEIVLVSPSENADVQKHRERIQSGEVLSILFSVEGVPEHNQATRGSGVVYARLVGEEWLPETPENAIATFDDAPVELGTAVQLSITPEKNERINNLLFPEDGPRDVEVKISGHTDRGPLAFDGRLSIEVSIEASIIE
jgi:hypothetical protein